MTKRSFEDNCVPKQPPAPRLRRAEEFGHEGNMSHVTRHMSLSSALHVAKLHRLQEALKSGRIIARRIERQDHAPDSSDDLLSRDGPDKAGVRAVIARIAEHEVMTGGHDYGTKAAQGQTAG